MAFLKITDASGSEWQIDLQPFVRYTIGRSPDNRIVLNDPRVSRHHAQIDGNADSFSIIDGYEVNGEFRRSINKVFVNGQPFLERKLEENDEILIGASKLIYHQASVEEPTRLNYDDQPLGKTQLLISANQIFQKLRPVAQKTDEILFSEQELQELMRKAQVLELLYEMSKTLGSIFDLEQIFAKATDVVFRVTPADRVVALLTDEKGIDEKLTPIATKARDDKLSELTEKMTISRTITSKVMRDKVSLLSQDARTDVQFSGAESIVAQGVRSTICAPLLTESGVHGAIYADRLDPFATFSADDLELLTAIASQTAVSVEMVRAHERLAKEEVARANYSRFLPEYVVQQILEKPDSITLGGVNQLITVLFADIRGFTRLSEHAEPEKVLQLLNLYFSEMTEIIFSNGGTLDKYIGDGLMALFGAPTTSPEDARNALQTAVEMQKRVESLNEDLKTKGFETIGVGIGLHTGIATVGYVGSERRSEYTAIGDTVNLAARLESNAQAGQILLSEATAQESLGLFPLIPHAPLTVKNRMQAVHLFEVQWN